MSDASLKNLLGKEPLRLAPKALADRVAAELANRFGGPVYPASVRVGGGALLAVLRNGVAKTLIAAANAGSPTSVAAFAGQRSSIELCGVRLAASQCPLSADNATALRGLFDGARPQVLGLATSAGMGDRLGLATPAHLAAVAGSGVAPVIAQQSIREMARTGRNPQQVMDDATWGALEAGWDAPWGADADHLKTPDDIDATAAAGFRMFTIDPGDHVDNDGDSDDGPACRAKYDRLPWGELEITAPECREAYQDRTFKLPGGLSLHFSEEDVKRAAVKYGRAVLHTLRMFRHLSATLGGTAFDLEMSVDETDTATTPQEHYFVANELRRLGVRATSLAPRFVGRFEKGVDYIGDVAEFRRQFALHAAIARELGPYKLSLHSGSDKFSIYPIAAELTGGLVHLKTAGTSYLEALRAVGRVQPALFREILAFAIERYEEDKRTYHVSAELAKVRRPDDLADGELESVLDQFDGRQVLHVTFGSVLTAKADGGWRFRDRLLTALREHEAEHYNTVSSHLRRHIEPFAIR